MSVSASSGLPTQYDNYNHTTSGNGCAEGRLQLPTAPVPTQHDINTLVDRNNITVIERETDKWLAERDMKANEQGRNFAFGIVAGMIGLIALDCLVVVISSSLLVYQAVPLCVFGAIGAIALLIGICSHYAFKSAQKHFETF